MNKKTAHNYNLFVQNLLVFLCERHKKTRDAVLSPFHVLPPGHIMVVSSESPGDTCTVYAVPCFVTWMHMQWISLLLIARTCACGLYSEPRIKFKCQKFNWFIMVNWLWWTADVTAFLTTHLGNQVVCIQTRRMGRWLHVTFLMCVFPAIICRCSVALWAAYIYSQALRVHFVLSGLYGLDQKVIKLDNCLC